MLTNRIFIAFTVIFVYAVFSTGAFAAGSEKELWKKSTESKIPFAGQRGQFPEQYLTFRLDTRQLGRTLKSLSSEIANSNTQIEVPMPDGTIQRFSIVETSVLSDELAAANPTWKTFRGYGIDDPSAIGYFDWNLFGFHGFISTKQGTVYIDPYQKGDTSNYLVFYKHNFGRSENQFYCRAEQSLTKSLRSEYYFNEPAAADFSFGATVRTYRLAVATTGEWSRNAAGYTMGQLPIDTRNGALAVVTTTVNRLNGIFERELASRFALVNPPTANDMTNILFDDPATDPYDNTDGIPQLTVNQTTIDTRVGTGNYDVGHLYGTGGGGVATSPSLCRNGTMMYPNAKAQGYSARGTNTGDPFTVDYVAHELGHQFGADHTYNNSEPTGACTTRAATDAFEVASGSTIMSYVGICTQRNLQRYVDTGFSSFHIRSLTTIANNIATDAPNDIAGCGPAAGVNAVPTVNAGASVTIPRLTPFTLTATGADADAGDVPNLLYSWEQYDLAPMNGASGTLGMPANTYDVDTDGVLRPLLRAYSPVSGNARTFPSLNFILNPATNDPAGSNQPTLDYTGTHPTGFPGAVCEPMVTCVIGERLPTAARTMNFRVSLRDRRGGVVDAGTTVAVAGGTGPFRVTTINTLADFGVVTSWQGNTSQTVTWDVAGTTANGINAANVKISLSTDGGQTFPLTLAASTPNDGTEAITVPNNPTTQARIKVEAVGNIFFDINNVNFAITAATATRSRADFDGDGRTDLSVYRPSEGNWYLNRSTSGFSVANFGLSTDVIVPADYDGDGKADFAVWRPTNTEGQPDFYLLKSTDSTVSGVAWGITGDTPVVADYDGDGKADFAIWRPASGDFYVLQSQSGALRHYRFGSSGDKPVVADYDGDGKTDFAVFRPSNATWYIARSIDNVVTFTQWGISTDIPVFADYDGDSKDDVAVFRPSDGIWYIRRSTGGNIYVPFGQNGDVPVPGDYDGDGKNDQAVYRGGTWYLNRSTAGFSVQQFGLAADQAVPNAYVR